MADEKIVRNIKEFTSSSTCKEYGKIAELKVESMKGNAYERAVAHKDIISMVLSKEAEISDVNDLVSQGIESMYSLNETNKAMLKKETANLERYLRCETRKLKKAPLEVVDIRYENIGISLKPDMVYIDKNNREVETIFYRSGSPSINERTGIKPEKISNMKEWFKLFVGKEYAREYAEKNLDLKKGDVYTVKSSYYFMRKTTDKDSNRDNDFFSGNGGNVVSIEDKFVFGAPSVPTDEDRLFYKFIDDVDTGMDCCEEDCKTCMGNANCKYSKAPVKLDKKTTKKRAAITPSDSQLAIIEATKGIFKVNATAGSGKTECMTERTKRLIAGGTSSKDILHISFTDAAVGEMKDRVSGKCLAENIKVNPEDIECYTFNAFANKAIGKFYSELGFTKAPAILTPEFELNMIEKLCDENPVPGIDAGAVSFSGDGNAVERVILIAQKTFDFIKSHRIDPNNSDAKDELVSLLREVGYYKLMSDQSIYALMDMYKDYDKLLKEDNFVTYSDQEPLMFKVLDMHPEYFDNLGYKHIIVDEFQDSNEIQVETLKKLIQTPSFESLMVVGDDSQAIYAFRETTPEYIINFDKYIGQPVTELYLTENRRSTPEIVDIANAINKLNENRVDKNMVSTRETGNKPIVRGFYSKNEEYAYILENIVKKVKEENVAPENIAFIAAKKTELVEMGTMLTKAGIPWVMKNPMDLMANSRVLAAMSIADAFYQPEATILYFQYLAAKYDGEILNLFTIDEINDMIADMKAEFEVIYLRDMDEQRAIFHRYLDDIKNSTDDELYNYFLDLLYANEDLPSELEYTRIFKKYGSKMSKKMDQNYEGVVLTTAHSSKGLEWPVVFNTISSFDAESLHKNTKRSKAAVEEKRRLLFVSTTRARDELIVTGQYVAYGPKDNRTYNQFLKELYDIVGGDYQPVDPMEAIRDAERKAKNREKAKERYAAKKLEKSIESILKDKKGKSRELSKEEADKYDKMVKGSKQMSLFDIA